ncbi:hypothetical protein B0H66DRAFT_563226 [Apodospora peruviana]|uniref:Uncharacterized protein n=1 Tax=Apodospora peruviana TaxID=516989 RepID=A0AAE0M0E7_9PEZI|nr:hypothetical protein B0H66DRAFT_563226 [Apodospora peruviana]
MGRSPELTYFPVLNCTCYLRVTATGAAARGAHELYQFSIRIKMDGSRPKSPFCGAPAVTYKSCGILFQRGGSFGRITRLWCRAGTMNLCSPRNLSVIAHRPSASKDIPTRQTVSYEYVSLSSIGTCCTTMHPGTGESADWNVVVSPTIPCRNSPGIPILSKPASQRIICRPDPTVCACRYGLTDRDQAAVILSIDLTVCLAPRRRQTADSCHMPDSLYKPRSWFIIETQPDGLRVAVGYPSWSIQFIITIKTREYDHSPWGSKTVSCMPCKRDGCKNKGLTRWADHSSENLLHRSNYRFFLGIHRRSLGGDKEGFIMCWYGVWRRKKGAKTASCLGNTVSICGIRGRGEISLTFW